jgi:hypothetical protein
MHGTTIKMIRYAFKDIASIAAVLREWPNSYLICIAVGLVRPSLWDKQCALKQLSQNLLEM